MEKYYVSGCVDNGIDIETVEDDVAEFWTLYERDAKGLSQGIVDLRFREDAEAVMAVYVERDALQKQVKALAAEKNWWKPERCPVTNRPFFLWIEHPTVGMVPTYGGPYDSYTIPEVDNDGEFSCERFDHDEGGWVDGVCLNVRLIDDQQQVVDEDFIAEIKAQGAEKVADCAWTIEEHDHAVAIAAQLRAKPEGEAE